MNAIILGSNSDLAKAITPSLEKDYLVTGWKRGPWPERSPWDVLIITIGSVSPVGLWHDVDQVQWAECLYSNLTLPLQLLRRLWGARNPNATVIWFTGSNPQRIMDGYSAYNVSKMAVNKLVEQLDQESPDCKFVAFGPGYHDTKIHKATKDFGWKNDVIERGAKHGHEEVWRALEWIIQQPKETVGGRNICVSDLVEVDGKLTSAWVSHHFGKLRRVE